MRFFIVKKEQACRGCGSSIVPGEEAVVIRIYEGIPLCFHVVCFLAWNRDKFNTRYLEWKQGITKGRKVKSKMGRPRVYVNSQKAHNIYCKMRYYEKVGNDAKIRELQNQLNELKT